jgi:hypothetical protein
LFGWAYADLTTVPDHPDFGTDAGCTPSYLLQE